MAIEVKEAVKRAMEAMATFYPEDQRYFRLEEVAQENEQWQITISQPKPVYVGPLQAFSRDLMTREVKDRDFKVIHLDADTGNFIKMRMR